MRAGLCICVLEPRISAFRVLALLAAASRIMSVSHRPSSSQALYFVADPVQQQSHGNFVRTTTNTAYVDITYARVLCVL